MSFVFKKNDLEGKKIGLKGRKAASTIEISLAITLSVIVLFVALAIFGDNLKITLEEGNMKNVWGGGFGNVDPTEWTKGSTSSKTQIAVTADLDAIYAEAKKTLDDLMAKGELTEAEKRIAALNLTIVGVSGPEPFMTNVEPYLKHFSQDAYGGVKIDNSSGATYVSGSFVDWSKNNTENYGATRGGQDSIDKVVENIRAIKSVFGE